MNAIECLEIRKEFTLAESRGRGVLNSIKDLLSPTYRSVLAVDGVSFSIPKGEIVALIGPNGAGKSTTIKMLCGILTPTSGQIMVAGVDPQRQRRRLPYLLGAVFGQRSQLWFHLSARDSFEVLIRLYDLDVTRARARLGDLIDRFAVGGFVDVPLRRLSLGERMRCEIIAALLHQPEVLLLDEPTIGLDIVAKQAIRGVVREMNEHEGTTILLTSHDAGDIEALARRTIVINYGKVIFDGSTDRFRKTWVTSRRIEAHCLDPAAIVVPETARALQREPGKLVLEVDAADGAVKSVAMALLSQDGVRDITVADPALEDVIGAMYRGVRR